MSSCHSLKYYSETSPRLDIKEYFQGDLKAWGMVQDWKGKVITRFDIDMYGSWDGDTGTLDETFNYYDGKKWKRKWVIKKLEDGKYEGEALDVKGKALGYTKGSVGKWNYVLDLPVDNKTYRLSSDVLMVLMRDNVLLYRSYMKKFGFKVAKMTIVMKKQNRER